MLRQVATHLSIPVGAPLTALPEVAFVAAALPEIDALILTFLEQLGIRPRHSSLPMLADAHRAGLTIISHENWQAFNSLLSSNEVSPDVASRIRAGKDVDPAALEDAERVRYLFTAQVDALLEHSPLLALATLPELPPTLQEAEDPLSVVNLTRLVRPFNLSGHPALTLPVGELHSRPVALQLVAAKGHDGLLIQAAQWLCCLDKR